MQKNFLRVSDLLHFLFKFAPAHLVESWDHVGLQVGRKQDKITGVLVALDASEAGIFEAIKNKCNVMVTHHPLKLKFMKPCDVSAQNKRILVLAKKHKINILSFHTNLDATQYGLNDMLVQQLSLQQVRVLNKNPKNKKCGLGRLGKLPKSLTLKTFCQKLLQQLPTKHLRFIGNPNEKIKTVAVMSGSGAGFWQEAKLCGADVLVTGDVKYHTALDAQAEGIALVDVGHYGSEIGMIHLVKNLLTNWQPKLKIIASTAHQDPFFCLINP